MSGDTVTDSWHKDSLRMLNHNMRSAIESIVFGEIDNAINERRRSWVQADPMRLEDLVFHHNGRVTTAFAKVVGLFLRNDPNYYTSTVGRAIITGLGGDRGSKNYRAQRLAIGELLNAMNIRHMPV